jgi:hypothetical protein
LDGTAYSDTLKIPATAGEVAETTVHIRYKSQATASAAQTKIIALTSVGNNKTYISCSGLVKSETGLHQISSELDLKVTNGNITISNLNKGEIVNIYNQLGQRIYSAITLADSHNCAINTKGMLLIQVGNKYSKLIIK